MHPQHLIKKNNLKEILRLNLLLHKTTDEEEIKAIDTQIKMCKILDWKDYKSVYKTTMGSE